MNSTRENANEVGDAFPRNDLEEKLDGSDSDSNSQGNSSEAGSLDSEETKPPKGCIGKPKVQLTFRIFVIIAVGIALSMATFFPGVLPKDPIECIKDQFFIQTTSINNFFHANPSSAHAFMIICGLAMDITVITGLLVFVIKGKTWRLPLTMAIFYLTRLIVQKTFLMRFPDGYFWENPGFPSLTVPYGATNDFFYSGHIGGAVIMTLEYRARAKEEQTWVKFYRGMQIFGIITTFLQVFLMIFLRGHYSIDLFTGAVVGHYVFILVSGWVPKIDRLVCKLDKKEKNRSTREEIRRAISTDTFTENFPQDARSPLVGDADENSEEQYFRNHSGTSLN